MTTAPISRHRVPAGEFQEGREVLTFETDDGTTVRVPAMLRDVGGAGDDRWAIESLLAAGGMGVVLTAQDRKLRDREVLVKLVKYSESDRQSVFPAPGRIAPRFDADIGFPRDRLATERELLVAFSERTDRIPAVTAWVNDYSAQLHGPHEGSWYGDPSGDQSGGLERLLSEEPYLVMQRIRGANLRTTLEDGGLGALGTKQRWLLVADVGRQLCTLLDKFHTRDDVGEDDETLELYHVYQDLKPSNIMRTPGGSLFLIDFGTVQEVGLIDGELLGDFLPEGSDGYRAPELDSDDPATPGELTDLFSLGATLYHLLSDTLPPLKGLSAAAAALSRHDGYPPALVDLVVQLCRTRPEDRPQREKPSRTVAVGLRKRFKNIMAKG